MPASAPAMAILHSDEVTGPYQPYVVTLVAACVLQVNSFKR